MKKTRVLVFGNPLIREDSTPLKLVPKLRKKFPGLEFTEFDPSESIESQGSELYIIDTVEGIRSPKVFEDESVFERPPHFSLHDADLAFSLKFMRKLGMLKKLVVFGLPKNISEEKALKSLDYFFRSSSLL